MDDAVVYGGKIYYLSLNRLFCAELLQEGASALLLETGSRVDCLSADASTGMLSICAIPCAPKTHIYTYDTAAGTRANAGRAAAAGRVTALDGKLFLTTAFSTADGECLHAARG